MDRSSADDIAAALDLRLERERVCPMCLIEVCWALGDGDDRALRRALRYFTPLLWDEGLDEPIKVALERARTRGVAGVEEAIADVQARGPRSLLVEAVVRHLARQQLEEMNRSFTAALN